MTDAREANAGQRCRRRQRCLQRVAARNSNGDTVGFVAAELTRAREGMCPPCVAALRDALGELPGMVAGFPLAAVPTPSTGDNSLLMTKLSHSPVPLNLTADALTRHVDYETGVWAERVAEHAGVPWDTALAASLTPYRRITEACQLLAYRVEEWLAEGDYEYRARSISANPLDGHDPDTTTRYRQDWWCHRDGPDAALAILDLHRRAEAAARIDSPGEVADWVPVPCGYCGARRLYRRHPAGSLRMSDSTVVCRACGDTRSDAGHDLFLAAALAAAPKR